MWKSALTAVNHLRKTHGAARARDIVHHSPSAELAAATAWPGGDSAPNAPDGAEAEDGAFVQVGGHEGAVARASGAPGVLVKETTDAERRVYEALVAEPAVAAFTPAFLGAAVGGAGAAAAPGGTCELRLCDVTHGFAAPWLPSIPGTL